MDITYDHVLVTGGAGFIGSHTVDALLRAGVDTWVVDDLSTGSLANLANYKSNPKLHFVKGDLRNFKTVNKLAKRVDAVIHLAAVISPLISVQRPDIVNEVNVRGTLNVLRACCKHKVQRIVFASSSSVYGQLNLEGGIDESCQTNPITPYGASKLAGEKYCRAFCATYRISAVSLRYFNVYGDRQRDNPYSGVVAIFANGLLQNRRATIYGDGRQTRDFVHVIDVARANLAALELTSAKGEAFNIGTGIATSINELYALIAQLTGVSKMNPIRKPERVGDIRDSYADMSKARKSLHFHPRVTLERGLSDLIDRLDKSRKPKQSIS